MDNSRSCQSRDWDRLLEPVQVKNNEIYGTNILPLFFTHSISTPLIYSHKYFVDGVAPQITLILREETYRWDLYTTVDDDDKCKEDRFVGLKEVTKKLVVP